MNTLALILMILVQLTVTVITVLLILKVARSGFESGEDEPGHDSNPDHD